MISDWIYLPKSYSLIQYYLNKKQQEVKDAIDNIDLNCDYWVKNRQNYYCEYLKMESEEEGRKYLQKNAPILLAELLRPSQKTTVVEDV